MEELLLNTPLALHQMANALFQSLYFFITMIQQVTQTMLLSI